MRKILILLGASFLFSGCLITSPELERIKPVEGSEMVLNIPYVTNYKNAKIEKGALIGGCLKQDCLPSIDIPKFETAADADKNLLPEDLIIGLKYQGITRAYPQRILNFHEIVNDKYNEEPIAITFDPLSGTAIAFDRTVDGIITELGVSGLINQSNLVIYDRYEGNLWNQLTGEALVGPAAGRDEILKQIPITTTTWANWKKAYPETSVLSRDTGYDGNYNLYPYGTYESDDQILFAVENLDNTIQLKTRVFGLRIGEKFKAYPIATISAEKTITDQIDNQKITIQLDDDGQMTAIVNEQPLIGTRLFWFAWAAQHPQTALYQP